MRYTTYTFLSLCFPLCSSPYFVIYCKSEQGKSFVSVLSKEDYLERRIALLEREKALTREKDALSEARRNLGFMMVEEDYAFQDEEGEDVLLSSLFTGSRPVLMVQHFMFDDEWETGCSSCSLMCDAFSGFYYHLGFLPFSFLFPYLLCPFLFFSSS